MPSILHLSDLHLSFGDPRDEIGDFKSPVVPSRDRDTRTKTLRRTLEQLKRHLREQEASIDCVVVSGDITVAADPDGLERLDWLLEGLGEARPQPEAIVVVPGNHDVRWQTLPGARERYADFIKHVRGRGFVTPMLDGVDLGKKRPPTFGRHLYVSDKRDLLVVPINSSNYCGVVEPLTDLSNEDLELALADISDHRLQERVRSQINRLRLHDVARVSPNQLDELRRLLERGEARGLFDKGAARVAVIHHHLMPVSPREEVKTFEGITNLGQLRAFLRDNRIDLVLHGHKHTSHIERDIIPAQHDDPADAGDVLIVSGSTIGGEDFSEREVARLIKIDVGNYDKVLDLHRVAAVSPGGKLPAPEPIREGVRLTRASVLASPALQVVSAKGLDEAYALALNHVGADPEREQMLVVSVLEAPRNPALPAGYPSDELGVADPDRWIRDQVDWWLRRQTNLPTYSHGERIFRTSGSYSTQIQSVVEAIRQKRSTSRAIISLIEPGDVQAVRTQKFPAFVAVQFRVVPADGSRFVNVIGYYRRQEMRYWWPVNFGELVRLGSQVVSDLRDSHDDFILGSITTVSSQVYVAPSVPAVAPPWLDVLSDNPRSGELQWLALALAVPPTQKRIRQELQAAWRRTIWSLVPAPDYDRVSGSPMPRRGDQELRDYLEWVRMRYQLADELTEIEALLSRLIDLNRRFMRRLDQDKMDTRINVWHEQATSIASDLSAKVEQRLAANVRSLRPR